MTDLLYYVFNRSPGVFDIIFYILLCGLTFFATAVLGSVRWWFVRRTRLPAMWKKEREVYEAEIKALKAEVERLSEELSRAQTAAFGEVVMTFRTATKG